MIHDYQAQEALKLLNTLIDQLALYGSAKQQAEDAVETINLFIIEHETYD